MSESTKSNSHGRSAYDIVEGGAGGEFHRALLLQEAVGTIEALIAEFEYDEGEAGKAVVEASRPLEHLLPLLSITTQAELVLRRECARCSGSGWVGGEKPCIECGGAGSVHAEEADG